MPTAPPTFCPTHGDQCRDHVHHARARRQQIVNRRDPVAHALYNTARWIAYRRTHLACHPLCARCEREGYVVVGKVVDHIIPHRGDLSLFWAVDGVQTLCVHHDSVKRARENGILPCADHGEWTSIVVGRVVCRDCGAYL
jgi:5-methylcytosine-specific restriction enzyme A